MPAPPELAPPKPYAVTTSPFADPVTNGVGPAIAIWLPTPLALRLARAYGTRATDWLGKARCLDDLGLEIAPGLHEAELAHLQRDEWAVTADDTLWRRSKLGLHLDARQRAGVSDWFAARTGA